MPQCPLVNVFFVENIQVNLQKVIGYKSDYVFVFKVLPRLSVYFSDVPRKFITFDEVATQRRAEARRSLVVQVNSESSFNELYGYCSKYGSISGVHHYKNNGGEVRNLSYIQVNQLIVCYSWSHSQRQIQGGGGYGNHEPPPGLV